MVPEASVIARYRPLVKSLAANRNTYHSEEDIEQQLWEHLIRRWPLYHFKPELERDMITKRILKNRLLDIFREQRRRPQHFQSSLNPYLEETTKFSDAFKYEGTYLSEIAHGSKLKDHILKWAKHQGDQTYKLLSEMIEPSEGLLDLWQQKRPNYQLEKLRPTSVPRTILFSWVKIDLQQYNKTLDSLRDYLLNNNLVNDVTLLGPKAEMAPA